MGKTKCKSKKRERQQVPNPKFKCKECGELAGKKKQLCEPKKI